MKRLVLAVAVFAFVACAKQEEVPAADSPAAAAAPAATTDSTAAVPADSAKTDSAKADTTTRK